MRLGEGVGLDGRHRIRGLGMGGVSSGADSPAEIARPFSVEKTKYFMGFCHYWACNKPYSDLTLCLNFMCIESMEKRCELYGQRLQSCGRQTERKG